jgi:hypothetical protein
MERVSGIPLSPDENQDAQKYRIRDNSKTFKVVTNNPRGREGMIK